MLRVVARKNSLTALMFFAVFSVTGTRLFAATESPNAPDLTVKPAVSGDWVVNCAPIKTGLTCKAEEMWQPVVEAGKDIATVMFKYADSDHLSLIIYFPFSSPHVMALQPGVGLVLNSEAPRLYAYRTCTGLSGCIVEIPMDDDLTESFIAATSIQFRAADINGTIFFFPISLRGFNAAKKLIDRDRDNAH